MKETIKKIMRSGGYAVIIATVAMALYLSVLEMGNKFIENQAVSLKISIDENGYLYTNYSGDTKNVYILWQTDGGTIKPIEKNDKLSEQYEDGNKWYFAYTGPKEKVIWDKNDADGNIYNEVTIRATVYLSTEDNGPFYVYEYISEDSITIKEENKTVIETEERLFSNPVREGESNWSQIYKVSKDKDVTETYMFRTGEEIKNPESMILIWEANKKILNQTDFIQGTAGGFKVNSENSGKDIIVASPAVTFNMKNVKEDDSFEIQAYLTYTDNSESKSGEIKEEEKFNKAQENIAITID